MERRDFIKAATGLGLTGLPTLGYGIHRHAATAALLANAPPERVPGINGVSPDQPPGPVGPAGPVGAPGEPGGPPAEVWAAQQARCDAAWRDLHTLLGETHDWRVEPARMVTLLDAPWNSYIQPSPPTLERLQTIAQGLAGRGGLDEPLRQFRSWYFPGPPAFTRLLDLGSPVDDTLLPLDPARDFHDYGYRRLTTPWFVCDVAQLETRRWLFLTCCALQSFRAGLVKAFEQAEQQFAERHPGRQAWLGWEMSQPELMHGRFDARSPIYSLGISAILRATLATDREVLIQADHYPVAYRYETARAALETWPVTPLLPEYIPFETPA